MKKYFIFSFLLFFLLTGCVSVKNNNTNSKNTSVQGDTDASPNCEDNPMKLGDHKYSSNPCILADERIKNKKAVMKTNKGIIEIELFGDDSPLTVSNFVFLAEDGYYDGIIFHRVIQDFMIQGGDPDGLGTGGPGYQFEDEFNDHKIVAGTLAMANSGIDSNGSQFFIVTEEAQPHLDGVHTAFGQVITGMDVVRDIAAVETDARDKPLEDVIIESITIENL